MRIRQLKALAKKLEDAADRLHREIPMYRCIIDGQEQTIPVIDFAFECLKRTDENGNCDCVALEYIGPDELPGDFSALDAAFDAAFGIESD